MEFFMIIDLTCFDERKRLIQLVKQQICFDKPSFTLRNSIYLAVDTIKVANLVGVKIHADRDSSGPPAKHWVDEAIGFKSS